MIEDLESRVGWDRKKILKDIHFLTDRELISERNLMREKRVSCLRMSQSSNMQVLWLQKDSESRKK